MLNNISAIIIILMAVFLFRRISKLIKEEAASSNALADQWAWMDYGLQKDWIRSYCATHDNYTTREEDLLFEEYDDPCIYIFRLITK